MKQFFSFFKKEVYHITRDKLTLSIMLSLPVVLLLVLGYAISTDIKNVPFVVLDETKSILSLQLVEKLSQNKYFELAGYLHSSSEIESHFQKGDTKLALVIPSSFNSDMLLSEAAIQVIVDASNPNEASTIANYAQLMIQQYMQTQARGQAPLAPIRTEVKMLYNPQMESTYNMVPGIIGLLMILICALMTSVSVVREKEMGTMEILLSSPLRPTTIIIAKALPYLIVGLIDNVLVIALAHFVLGVPIAGNLFLVFFLAFLFTFCALALGLLISTITDTQRSAMIASGAGLMLPTMLMSGIIFPISSMPDILQWISCINPARWFVAAIRDVMIRGVGLVEIWEELLILLGMTVFLIALSIRKFKNRL
jgi:ABC-2 type transport system permease protein